MLGFLAWCLAKMFVGGKGGSRGGVGNSGNNMGGSTNVREGHHVGVSEGGGAGGLVERQVGGCGANGVRDESGLNPNRIRGMECKLGHLV